MKNIEAKPGDLVEVHLSKEIYEGTLLEAPESEKETVLLKLGSGYNIGFNKRDILEIKLLEKQEEESKKTDLKISSGKPSIAMIITGGTIASKLDPKTGGVKWLENPENLFQFYPEIFDIVNVIKVEVPFLKGSESLDYKDWQKLAKITSTLLNDQNIKGVIITHGTDTLHYTSAALSFFLRDLNKPVVLTYSQRSIDRGSSDAMLNLKCAAIASISDIAEVMIVGHASTNDDFCFAMSGTKTRKLHASRRDAFKVVNSKPFAKIYENDLEIIGIHNLRNKGKVKLDSNFEEKVALIKFYPGQDPSILDYYVKEGYKGIVIEMFGLGQIATDEARISWTKKLKEVIKKGLIVCATPQTIYGRLDPSVYSTGRELLDSGVIYLNDILSETALVKLGWVLGHKDWNAAEKMLENFAREFSDRLEE
ncbi:MAG: Glu-tRNA(Gln) amidotransferase subunit GatD [Parcubacteria group bacterium]|jgi:glutamyl-tRNA(Gln) amidotransferase subunit D